MTPRDRRVLRRGDERQSTEDRHIEGQSGVCFSGLYTRSTSGTCRPLHKYLHHTGSVDVGGRSDGILSGDLSLGSEVPELYMGGHTLTLEVVSYRFVYGESGPKIFTAQWFSDDPHSGPERSNVPWRSGDEQEHGVEVHPGTSDGGPYLGSDGVNLSLRLGDVEGSMDQSVESVYSESIVRQVEREELSSSL